MSKRSIASRYLRWLKLFGTTRRRFHVAVPERIPLVDQILELLEDKLRAQFVLRLSFDCDLAALRADFDVQQRFDVFQVRVARTVQRFDALFWQRDSLHLIWMCSSRNCFASTGDGASDIRS